MIARTAQKALSAWAKEDATLTLVAQRENIVFRVDHEGAIFALRLHRPGYQTLEMMISELAWVDHLGTEGLTVPAPIPARNGDLLQEESGYHADLLTWLDGVPMGATGTPLDLVDRTGTFRRIGQLMARVHQISDAWSPPENFERRHWDMDGLLGNTPHWGCFWENPGLSPSERARTLLARDRLHSDLAGADLDYGLIHADMLRENIMINGAELGLIDFDDSGFGFRLFDVATTLFKNSSEPDYISLKTAFLEGYRTVRPLDIARLDQFMLIRALSYLGWIIPRMNEPGAKLRQARFLKSSMPLVDAYLAT